MKRKRGESSERERKRKGNDVKKRKNGKMLFKII